MVPPAVRVVELKRRRMLTSLPSLIRYLRAEQPVPLALVDCYLAKKDWSGLDASLLEQKWGDMEFLRFAPVPNRVVENIANRVHSS